MELLLSNYPPMKTKCRTFSDMFYSMVPKSTELDIAVGYITSDSLMELQRIVELNTLKALNLTIGMHYLERFTKVEYNAALKLNDFLTENKCGEVRLVTPFRYHGKLYSYSDEQGAFAGIIGSNNLSSIVEGGTTDNDEATDILNDEEFPENGLKTALVTHLLTSAHIMLSGGSVCNFLIHPSMKTDQHTGFAEKIGEYLNEIIYSYDEEVTRGYFKSIYDGLKLTKHDMIDFSKAYKYIIDQMKNDKISILVLNSFSSYEENAQYESGINILVGGNSLGRGVTFPQLQTIYYCRVAKSPQADTMWQHARMFGYDRDSELMRVFMPPKLFKLFSDINRTNNIIISQIEKSNNGNDIKIFYSTGLNPTRKNVIDKKAVGIYSGGVNYFPFYPVNKDIVAIDEILAAFADEVYTVSLKLISKVLDLVDSETTDWNAKVFKGFINSMLAENSSEQGKIIVRRDRDISKGTGTLLSPNDRKLGDQYDDEVVLTLYKVTGNKGWDGQKIWIPNIKLPGNRVYYSGNDIPEQDNKLCYDILVNTAKVAESTIPYDHNNK